MRALNTFLQHNEKEVGGGTFVATSEVYFWWGIRGLKLVFFFFFFRIYIFTPRTPWCQISDVNLVIGGGGGSLFAWCSSSCLSIFFLCMLSFFLVFLPLFYFFPQP